MSATLNYDLKRAPMSLFESGRWDVLTQLIIHSNGRNRCWPTMRRLAKRLGKSLQTISEAKKWLIGCGAMVEVPHGKRLGEERKLSKRQCVYELTGAMNVDGVQFQYLYVNNDDNGDVTLERTSDVTPSRNSSQRNQSISNRNTSKSKKEKEESSNSTNVVASLFSSYDEPFVAEIPVR